jgi:MoaA/NifB/PqqE/SkfB family radical SAM enzyme
MCDIWKTTDAHDFTRQQLDAQLDSIDKLGTRWVVFTGGEPLLNTNLFDLCPPLRDRDIQVSILSTGLLFERYAEQIAEHLSSAIVSIDGPPEIHDGIRHTPGGFAHIARGIAAIRMRRANFPITARSVVQKRNYHALNHTAEAARAIGIDSISFLAADLTSSAFRRSDPWPIFRQDEIALTQSELATLEGQLVEIASSPFVTDSREHLARVARHFRSHLGLQPPQSPKCNAPWVSALLRADGIAQPCFFHPPFSTQPHAPLVEILNSPSAQDFRKTLDVAANSTCQQCVCSLYYR